ncbi:MAG: hypothetical protein IJ504_00990 [Bacteroidales bacterium]|nr:hypothetical protein [Bacteroidales bacterium]
MKNENNLTGREEAAVRRHYGDSLLLVESWNETDEVTGERCRCLGILFSNEKKTDKYALPKPYITHTQKYAQIGEQSEFRSTDANGDMVCRELITGSVGQLLPDHMKEILQEFSPKPEIIILTQRICCQ